MDSSRFGIPASWFRKCGRLGCAVLGEISGDRTGFGVTGIAPDAVISASSFSLPTATALRAAADRLGPGDVLLLEVHRPRPRATGTGQQGFIAVEWRKASSPGRRRPAPSTSGSQSYGTAPALEVPELGVSLSG